MAKVSLVPPTILVAVITALSGAAIAQCTTPWVPQGALQGVDGQVNASTMWDPDGAGPLPALLILGGSFAIAGDVVASNIVAWDPTTGVWSALGSGTNGAVNALTVRANGELVVGGTFTSAGGANADCIARWDGATWSPLGSGISSSNSGVSALTTLLNGDVVAGGYFTVAGGVAVDGIAKWDGTNWSSLGAAFGVVNALLTMPNGDLIAGGPFATSFGAPGDKIARWNGSTWSTLGTGIGPITGTAVHALAVAPNGTLVVGGIFSTAGGASAHGLARWNGATWSSVGATQGTMAFALAVLANGDVVTGQTNGMVRWSGSSSTWLGVNGSIAAITVLPNGDLVAGGNNASYPVPGGGSQEARSVARWNGSVWSCLTPHGWNAPVRTLTSLANGDLLAGGQFTTAPCGLAVCIARRSGATWSPLGSGLDNTVLCTVGLPNGDVVAGGEFKFAGSTSTSRIARWDGTAWSSVGGGVSGPFVGHQETSWVASLLALPNGDLVVGGSFLSPANNIASWDGNAWSAFGSGTTGPVRSLVRLPNGDLVVGGQFTTAGGVVANNIARWDGSSWSTLGSGVTGGSLPGIFAMTLLPGGDLVAGGRFTLAGGVSASSIARWDGASWSSLGSGVGGGFGGVYALAALPAGDVLAGGQFTTAGGITTNTAARWNGTTWSAIGSGPSLYGVFAMASAADGDIEVGGGFSTVDGQVSPHFARLTTTCPATATTFGVGCVGSNGPDVLAATTLPWVDATFRAAGSGLPTVAIVLTLTSVTSIAQGAVPLATAFPQAGLGCDVLVAPDILGALVTTNGTAESQLFLPNTPPLVGVTFYHQFVSIEVDPQGAWTALTATNALQLLAGSF